VKAFYDAAVEAKIIEADAVDVTKVATDQFVNKKVGMDLIK
jgi:NitT/TauT family transport system substrate-binding protein